MHIFHVQFPSILTGETFVKRRLEAHYMNNICYFLERVEIGLGVS